VLFADVQLQSKEDPKSLRAHGLKLRASRSDKSPAKLLQPCAALEGCRCRIYELRPAMCRQFECHLLQRAQRGELKTSQALATIKATRKRIQKVTALLEALGENSTDRPLRWRFQNCLRVAEREDGNARKTDTLAELMLEMHQLNAVLQREFLP
jgi:Fe-S-cluster containining protein